VVPADSSLSSTARQLYIAILHKAPVPDERSEALAELLAFGLIVPHPHGPADRYIPLNPQQIASQRRDMLLAQLTAAMADAAALPESLQDLAIAYHVADPDLVRGAVEYVTGVENTNARISELVAECTQELLTSQPDGPRPAETLSLAMPRDQDAVRRGVAMRTLYHTSVRSDLATARYTAAMTSAGAHVRTLGEPFMRTLVFDRRRAVLSDYTPWTGPEPEPRRALIVHDEGLVHYVAAMFDRDWSRASIWDGVKLQADATCTELQQAIMRRLGNGDGQDAVASVLGISVRTVSAQLAEMRRVLGYRSTVQMAWELGRQQALDERRLGVGGADLARDSGRDEGGDSSHGSYGVGVPWCAVVEPCEFGEPGGGRLEIGDRGL
jgi:DNA-binding CsgD family transcriptional regulator